METKYTSYLTSISWEKKLCSCFAMINLYARLNSVCIYKYNLKQRLLQILSNGININTNVRLPQSLTCLFMWFGSSLRSNSTAMIRLWITYRKPLSFLFLVSHVTGSGETFDYKNYNELQKKASS